MCCWILFTSTYYFLSSIFISEIGEQLSFFFFFFFFYCLSPVRVWLLHGNQQLLEGRVQAGICLVFMLLGGSLRTFSFFCLDFSLVLAHLIIHIFLEGCPFQSRFSESSAKIWAKSFNVFYICYYFLFPFSCLILYICAFSFPHFFD